MSKMITLPKLYKITNTGALQFWDIAVDGNIIHTFYGQVGTDTPQETLDIISQGKNIGKKNETTPAEQALIEATQKWEKKVKSGYMKDRTKVTAGEVELPGIKPMLAHVYEDYQDKLKFPVIVQPKLDGMRCIAVIQDGKCQLYSRTQKAINTVPHIVEELEWLYEGVTITLDGELYVHSSDDNFNELMGILKRDELHPDHKKIEYHVYDTARAGNYLFRTELLMKGKSVKIVEISLAYNHAEVDTLLDTYIKAGFEGVMVRVNGPYENKRSKNLLKYKKFQDAEFVITGVEEGKGKLMGKAGAFVCETKEGYEFRVKMEGSLESLVEYLTNFNEYKGKYLTVRFFSLTVDGIPRFPVGVGFKNEKDLEV